MKHVGTIEPCVERAVESVLHTTVLSAERLPFGAINRVYKVETPGRAYVLKIFSQSDWPEDGKLQWVEAQLTGHAVPHARTLHLTRDASICPHGFSLNEYINGPNGKQALRDRHLSAFDYLELAGRFLKRVHDIAVPRYGYIGDGRGMYEDFPGWVLGCEVKDSLDELGDASAIEANLYAKVERRVERVLRSFEQRLHPVLVHADATPKNALLTADGQMLLVDWDEAVAAPWLKDYTNLTYWYSYIHKRSVVKAQDAANARDSFFRGYGEVEFDADELDALESALHIVQAVGILSFFFRRGETEGFGQTREILFHLLNAP